MAGQEPSSPTARGEGVLAEKIYVAQRPVTPADRANRWVRGKASASWHLFYGWLKPRLNWPSVKVVLRATIATWCGFILQLDSSAIRVLGHAAFLTLVVGVIDSCDRPLGVTTWGAFYSLTLICGSWIWAIIGQKVAFAVRRITNAQDAQRYLLSIGIDCSQDAATCLRKAEYAGHFIELKSSAVLMVFLVAGCTVLIYVKQNYLHLRISAVMATISMLINFTTAGISYTFNAQIGEVFIIPAACQYAINIAASCIIFPETVNHRLTGVLLSLLDTMRDYSEMHKRLLCAEPDSGEWATANDLDERFASVKQKAMPLALMDRYLDKEFSYSRLGAKDVRQISTSMQNVISAHGAFSFFFGLVQNNLSVYQDSKGAEADLMSHYQRQSAANSETQTPRSSVQLDADTDDNDGDTGGDDDDEASTAQNRRHLGVHIRPNLEGSHESLVSLAHAHAAMSPNSKKRSHKFIPSLLQEALMHQYKPVGLLQAQQYMDLESHADTVAEHEKLRSVIKQLRSATSDVWDECIFSLTCVQDWLRSCNRDRVYRLFGAFDHGHDAWIERLSASRKSLSDTYEQFKKEKRLDVIRPYEADFLHHTNGSQFSYRPLFHCFFYEFQVMKVLDRTLALLDLCITIEKKRPAKRLWYPTGVIKFLWPFATRQSGSTMFSSERDEHGDVPDPESSNERVEVLETEPRNPEALPPSNVFHLMGVFVSRAYHVLFGASGVFVIKAMILIALVVFPAFYKPSASFFQQERGQWVCIIAVLTYAPYSGDTAYGLISRLVGSFLGSILGMLFWYIGNGHGTGNPYGCGASMAFGLFFVIFIRVHYVYFSPMPAMIFGVTFAIVVGYSWQDTHYPMGIDIGYGFDVAWRRFVTVTIGLGATYVFSFIPKPVTARRHVRLMYGKLVSRLAAIHCVAFNMSAVRTSEETVKSAIEACHRIRAKLISSRQNLAMAQFEPAIQGKWPKQLYIDLYKVQFELIELYSTLIEVFSGLEPNWSRALMLRTGWSDRQFVADQLAVLYMCSHALRLGSALPQIIPGPLIERFYSRVYGFSVVDDDDRDSQAAAFMRDLPAEVTYASLQDPSYAKLAVGCTTTFAIVNRLDRLMFLTKRLVGEKFQVNTYLFAPDTNMRMQRQEGISRSHSTGHIFMAKRHEHV